MIVKVETAEAYVTGDLDMLCATADEMEGGRAIVSVDDESVSSLLALLSPMMPLDVQERVIELVKSSLA